MTFCDGEIDVKRPLTQLLGDLPEHACYCALF